MLRNSMSLEEKKGFIVEQKPKSHSSEAYKILRTNIQYSSYNKELKTILITSSVASEGKSTISGNLALSFAQDNKKVLLIDCDLRRPSIHKKFNVSNLIGLSEILIGKTDLKEAIICHNDNLDILTSGMLPPNPAEMLSSNSMSNLITTLKEIYDLIILDCCPLLGITDAQILSTNVDGTILVVQSEKTKKDEVTESKKLLLKVGANIVGVILNRIPRCRHKYYYY
ncbi:polysaccharide biosynthesis tyrosine autokinase [Clostridium chromiireducens]|uniref:non-specific protein-tyrosine kinase n=1 Tax=Clostridium chromiireducens TaxID=225345 RepID=A0A964W3Y8_9CLOT|nr:CpsD/CapB family tyrosine-protein kinase [Clostridium chromiireducens]MVX65633.1 polysaccharide biosynthesis tyrosine autokinase [Clostridium chromiireducens]